jgi:DMSO/TMAO reductase YedYZ molybdopterin-dependent catalytic subunit
MRFRCRGCLAWPLIITVCLGVICARAGEPITRDADVQLRIGGDVERPLTLKGEDLAKLSRQTLRVQEHDGRESLFEGVAIVELLRLAGVPLGKDLRGERMLIYLVVEAADGYRVVFALPEIDPAFTDRTILLVDRRDQQPLSAHEGPLRVIVPGEKRQARWVRQVTAFTVRRTQ